MGAMNPGMRGMPVSGPTPVRVRIIHRESVGWSIALSIVLILVGLAALAAPFLAGITATAIIAWLLMFGGIAHLILAFHVRGAGAHVWEALIGVAYLVAGFFLFAHPVAGLVSLTLFLGAYLVVKGLFELAAGFTLGGVPGRVWLFLDAVISILIGVLIWAHLPFTALWAVGTLLGIAILFSGTSRLAFALAARRHHLAFVG